MTAHVGKEVEENESVAASYGSRDSVGSKLRRVEGWVHELHEPPVVSLVESPLMPFPVGLGVPTSPPPKYSSGINNDVMETHIAGGGSLDRDCEWNEGHPEPPRRLGRRARQKANQKEARLRRAVE